MPERKNGFGGQTPEADENLNRRLILIRQYTPAWKQVSDEALKFISKAFPESPESAAWREHLRLEADRQRLEAAKLKIAQTRSEIADIWAIKVPAVLASLEKDAPERVAVLKEQTDQILKEMKRRSRATLRILKENKPEIKSLTHSELPPFLKKRSAGK